MVCITSIVNRMDLIHISGQAMLNLSLTTSV